MATKKTDPNESVTPVLDSPEVMHDPNMPFTDEELTADGQEAIGTGTKVQADMLPVEKVHTFTEDELSDISGFGDALRMAAGAGMLVGRDIIGDGFQVIDKADLVNRKCVILDINFYPGDYGDAVALKGVRDDGTKFVINDGSTGIRDQMKALIKRLDGKFHPFTLENGLRESRYTYEDDKGNETPAVTYYLAP